MTNTDIQRAAAHDAERAMWRHHGLAIVERYVDVPRHGLRVRVLESGDPAGAPVLFVQGGLGEAWPWASLMARLGRFRCLTLDRPGGGLSDPVDYLRVDVGALAADVLTAVIEDAGIGDATVVGNSMGGWWTLQLARRAPGRVSRIVLIGCPAVILETSAPLPMRLVSVPVVGNVVVRLMAPASPAKAREFPTVLGHAASVGERWSDAEAEVAYRMANLANAPRAWLTLLRRFLRPWGADPAMRIDADALRAITQPALLIWGTDDPFGGLDAGRRAASLLPGARLEVAGRGHLPWWDDPDTCARLIEAFVLS